MSAPSDQLFLATEINEWALSAALIERDPVRWSTLEQLLMAAASTGPQPVLDERAALIRFERLAAAESNPKLQALLEAAAARGLPHVVDESELTLGAGMGGRDFLLSELPDVDSMAWQQLADIPTAIVTGSNGKTTTVRLLAACARAHGWRTAYNCTDGVFLDDEVLALGDYSGPAGARRVMRDRRAQAAVLEVARGGILRRGIAVSRATVAVVTNVSADHFGEYGIDDLDGLAETKLAVASVVTSNGLLVLNADDAQIGVHAMGLVRRYGRSPRLAWFSIDPSEHALSEHRARGASTCGVRAGRLLLHHTGVEFDLGLISAMPLSMNGVAAYNVANMAGAALAAAALGIAPSIIGATLARFGSTRTDNPGRMMRFEVGGVRVVVDYAHNPDGLRGFLTVTDHLRGGTGRFGLVLGQAGNRSDGDIEELARVAARFRPDLVVIKENDTQLRGRSLGEVPRIIRAELRRLGMSDGDLPLADNEVDAARHALDWAMPGDLLAFPVHSSSARATVVAMLEKSSKCTS